MLMRRFWTGLAFVVMMAVPTLMITQQAAQAAGVPKAEWRPGTKAAKTKVVPKAKKAETTLPSVDIRPTAQSTEPNVVAVLPVADQSQEVLDVAAAITSMGPKDGYAGALSDEGILYDANGASPAGREAATNRFGSFPPDVTLARNPERALAAGGSGSSWGTYTIKRGETILSAGRYISVWRREVVGWKMISELAAGKTVVPPPANPISGALPRRPNSPGRAPPSPVGAPLLVPTPAPTAPVGETPPTP
jgi:hypothetical protein